MCLPLLYPIQQQLHAPAKATVAKYIKMGLSFTNLGLEAMKDVTYLNGRDPKHADHTTFDHKRVTLKMITRNEFYEMNGHEQEVYVFRIAK